MEDRKHMRLWYSGNMWSTYLPKPFPRPEAVRGGRDEDAGVFAQMRLGFMPDARQMEILRSNTKRMIINCSRQWGKTTVAAAKAVHRAYTRPGALVLVASPSQRQSAEFLRKASDLLLRLDIRPRGDGDNAFSLLLPNGARIVALPGTADTTRGYSAASLLLIDEASRMPDDVYQSLRPSLAVSGGDLWLMSTPAGQRGFFYETWVGEEKWMRVSVKATDCERLKPEFLEEERRVKTRDWFAQEYLCEFTGSDDAVFDGALIDAALDDRYAELQIGRR
jgi:hypothetical protein